MCIIIRDVITTGQPGLNEDYDVVLANRNVVFERPN